MSLANADLPKGHNRMSTTEIIAAEQAPHTDDLAERVPLLLVDPNALFREGLRDLLAASQFQVIGEASDLTGAQKILGAERGIGIVVVDLDEDESDKELQILRQMRRANAEIKWVVLTNDVSINLLARALSAGVDGYLLKSISLSALQHSLRLIALGEKVLPTKLATMITDGQLDPNEAERRISSVKGFSDKERLIMASLNQGHSNKVIARRLDMTEATVKVHMKAVMRKINVANRTEAAIWAVRNGRRHNS